MIHDLVNLIRGLGDLEHTKAALDWFREEAIRHGLPGLHLQYNIWHDEIPDSDEVNKASTWPAFEYGKALGFDSIIHYQYRQFADVSKGYLNVLKDVEREYCFLDTVSNDPIFSTCKRRLG